jgi:hypothetical protein
MFKEEPSLALSVVLVAYNMNRELPRTLQTLAPSSQLGISPSSYEVIVIDNGSTQQVDVAALRTANPLLRYFAYHSPSVSPVDALNYGISLAKGDVVCACIDAARMASPGLLSAGLLATRIHSRAVVGPLSYHLGYECQNISVTRGYNQRVEDELLGGVDWERNGYELFKIASFDPSSRFGSFGCPSETNALFMTRQMWLESGGFDARFRGKGGGAVNLEIWRRLCGDPKNFVVILLGEGTFHQFHGGVATNSPVDIWPQLNAEFKEITGAYFEQPTTIPNVFGRLNQYSRDFMMKKDFRREEVSATRLGFFSKLGRAVGGKLDRALGVIPPTDRGSGKWNFPT